MTKKDLIREICKYSKANGVKITKKQANMVLEAFREVSLDACRKGDRVVLRNFITIICMIAMIIINRMMYI